ncbi:MAG: Rieske 2Fe-2S domain-containing protein [Bacteroidota bacterium]|nr:Rieske 2Fe-2S domain-containing protein [Bacteroidota bacterium]
MDRRAFIGNLSVPFVAACAACLSASCGKSASSPANSSGTGTGTGPTSFNVDLGSQITNVGDSLVQNGVIIVRTASGNTASSFAAVQVACTHQGTSIGYEKSANDFLCPNHGSRFALDGSVINGPATNPLKKYNIAISGSTMTISG